MKFEEQAILLTAESKPYNMNGNSGVSHRVRVSVKGEVFACKSTEEQVIALKPFEGQEGTAVLKLKSVKENLSIELVSFE